MIDDKLGAAVSFQKADALTSLEEVMAGHLLPTVYNEILISHWIDIANAVLEEYGEDSDSWRRMIWFSRIICNAITASIEQGETGPLDSALKTFMTWLGLCNRETSSLDLALVAAQYLGKRLVNQVVVDQGSATEASSAAGVENTLAEQASTLPSTPLAEPLEEQALEVELEPETAMESELTLEPEFEPEPTLEAKPELETAPEPLSVLEMEPEPELTLTMDPAPEPMWEAEQAPESELVSEPELAAATMVATKQTASANEEGSPTITTPTGSYFMDIPSLTETSNTEHKSEAEMSMNDSSPSNDRRGKRRPTQGPVPIVPIGVWLGFHDEDVSTMVKLAVYDRANDNYIFSNKQGFLARQLSKDELLDLIEEELVDIIERRQVKSK